MLAKKENSVRQGLILRKMKAPSHTHVQKPGNPCVGVLNPFLHVCMFRLGPFKLEFDVEHWRKFDVGLRSHVCEHVHIFCD